MPTQSITNYRTSNSPLSFQFYSNKNTLNGTGDYTVLDPTTGWLKSLFGNTNFVPYPFGTKQNGDADRSNVVHNDDIYDISVSSLITYSKPIPSMALKSVHFAYLKNLGVFPNNRLLIARRFPTAIGNDLTAPNIYEPIATLISWVPNDGNFMDGMTFGEDWVKAQASFEKVLNSVGDDTKLSSDQGTKLGSAFSAGFNVIPMPGLMEGIQRQIMVDLGIVDPKDSNILPGGNPNLIRTAMTRRVLEKGEEGSGLKCNFEIKMKVEYEQKYINGIDNTIPYFDLVANVLSFATSESTFMYNNSYAKGANNLLDKLISGDINGVMEAIKVFLGKFLSAIEKKVKEIAKFIGNVVSDPHSQASATGIKKLFEETLGAVIGKYKMAIIGIISALTGVASTPWHITIGNPKRPFFSSGDMWMDNVKLTMGPVLGWNDIPTEVTIEFTLKNSRPLGAQEIYNRFNIGKGRSYVNNIPNIAGANSDTLKPFDQLIAEQNAVKKQTNFGEANVNQIPGNGKTTPFI